MESPSSAIILPIASAIFPDTPVSISSNSIVGSLVLRATMDFRASMTRDVSPPEAMRSRLWSPSPPLALNRNRTLSAPEGESAPEGVISVTNRAEGIPKRASTRPTASSNRADASVRLAVTAAASPSAVTLSAPVSASSSAISASESVMASSLVARSFPSASSSSDEAAP